MTSSDRVLARRYALALYQMSAEQRHEEKTAKELADAHKALLERMEVFKHPMISGRHKKAMLQQLLGSKVSPGTTRFLDLLIDKKRFQLLPMTIVEFGRLLDQKRGRARAQVRSATELSPQEEEKLCRKLKQFSGKEVIADVKVDPELLGGVIVRLDDWVIDGSLRGKLRRLGAQLAGSES